jgi:hypothetical protein
LGPAPDDEEAPAEMEAGEVGEKNKIEEMKPKLAMVNTDPRAGAHNAWT